MYHLGRENVRDHMKGLLRKLSLNSLAPIKPSGIQAPVSPLSSVSLCFLLPITVKKVFSGSQFVETAFAANYKGYRCPYVDDAHHDSWESRSSILAPR
jgi:hypothetical protein